MAKLGPTIEGDPASMQRRYEAIRALAARPACPLNVARATAADLGVSERYVYALLRRFRTSGGEPAVLLSPGSRGGPGKSRLPARSEEIVRAVIEETRGMLRRPPVSALFHEVVERCARAGVRPPSAATIWRRLRAVLDEGDRLSAG